MHQEGDRMNLKKVVNKAIADGIKIGNKVKKYMIDDTLEDVEKIIGTSSEKKDVPEKEKEKEE